MSEGPIYLDSVAITLTSEGKKEICSLTDLHDLVKHPDKRSASALVPGLASLRRLHPARLVSRTARQGRRKRRRDLSTVDSVEVLTVAIYGPDAPPVGAARLFKRDCDASDDNCWQAEPSRQLRNFWERRRLKPFLRWECFPIRFQAGTLSRGVR